MSTKKTRTAKELMDELEKDPEFIRRRAEKAETIRLRSEQYARLNRPILQSLEAKGFPADSIENLVREYAPLPTAIVDTLLSRVAGCKDPRHCESLIRALGAAEKPFDGRILAQCYDATSDHGLRFAIANTIALAKPYFIEDWLSVARNDRWLRQTLDNCGQVAKKRQDVDNLE